MANHAISGCRVFGDALCRCKGGWQWLTVPSAAVGCLVTRFAAVRAGGSG